MEFVTTLLRNVQGLPQTECFDRTLWILSEPFTLFKGSLRGNLGTWNMPQMKFGTWNMSMKKGNTGHSPYNREYGTAKSTQF